MTNTETSAGPIATFRFYDQVHLDDFRAEHVERPCSDLSFYGTLTEIKPTPASDHPGLREYLRANMLDGDEGGRITMRADAMLDEVCGLVAEWARGEAVDEPVVDVTFGELALMLRAT